MAEQPGALAGLRVIEMGQLIAGPFAGKTLADFGAEVIKIEPPGTGDPLRNWRLIKEGTSVWWQVQSRNKRSIALDLPPDRRAFLDEAPVAQRIARARRLDLDHVGAEFAERLSGEGAGDQLAHFDHAHAVKGAAWQGCLSGVVHDGDC